MNKFFIILSIFLLILVTTITKNSTKKLEDKIFLAKEDIKVLREKYELVLLDYNFLTSPKRLLKYKSKYFQNDLESVDINTVKKISEKNNELIIKEFNELNNEK
tara:strand:+ start:239 stop:550 length:312 start_codon:yes stop_codon:yes gene_type:complete